MNITIIIPFYNREKYLLETLQSVLNQSFKNFQVVLIDDCSTDSSFRIAKKIQQKDSRFVIIKNTLKQRQGKAKNQAIDYTLWINSMLKNSNNLASNDRFILDNGGGISIFGQLSSYTNYILFLDSDDLLDKNALQILISKAIHSSADITACSFQCFGENNTRIIHKEGLLKTSDILKDARYFSFGWGGLIKISFFMSGLKFIDSIHMINDDNFFGLDLFLRANNVYYTSKICVYYRVAYGSISNPKSYHLNGLENLL